MVKKPEPLDLVNTRENKNLPLGLTFNGVNLPFEENWELNGLDPGAFHFVVADIFRFLRDETLAREGFDLVILDVKLPDRDGVQLLEIIKSRSACSVRVANPVEGPGRCAFTMTSGVSVMPARDRPSTINAKPPPELPVIARTPPKDAPSAILMAAISSSACSAMMPKVLPC
jgi:hypothetical protein